MNKTLELFRACIGAFCTEWPPGVYSLEAGEGLRLWIATHRKREFLALAPAEIMAAAATLAGVELDDTTNPYLGDGSQALDRAALENLDA